MKYQKTIKLKNSKNCLIRNANDTDGEEALNVFVKTHAQTDFLLSYPDECNFTVHDEMQFLKEKAESKNEVELVAVVDGKIVGTAGIEAIGKHSKISHRAEFGIGIQKEYWGLGIGTALLEACIECAKTAGYKQLELNVMAENKSAIRLYEKAGFVEFGRNPRGFKSRMSGYQELLYFKLEL